MFFQRNFFSLLPFRIAFVICAIASQFAFSQLQHSKNNILQKKETRIIGDKGFYPVHNYTTKEYHSLPQNWAIVRDKRGVMYFGNNEGILEYDGVSWRMIRVDNETNIRSLAINEKGKIFVGAQGEFGYLEPDSVGNMKYYSLILKVEKKDRDFTDIWSIQTTKNGVFFQADNKIFRWDGKKIKVWNAQRSFHRMFFVNDHLYIRQREIGLMEILNDELLLLRGGEIFANEAICAMVPCFGSSSGTYSGNIIICSEKKGLFQLNPISKQNILPGGPMFSFNYFSTQIDKFLLENKSYNLIKLENSYSIGTLTKGFVNIDTKGNLLDYLNKGAGLQDETIYAQYKDTSGNLWLALSNGISKLHINSPVTFFNAENGLNGTVLSIVRHDNTIFAATNLGVFYLSSAKITNGSLFTNSSFQKIQGINEDCWHLLSFSSGKYSSLLIASNINVFSVDKNKKVNVVAQYGPWCMYRSLKNPARVFIGLDDGFASIYWDGKRWYDEGRYPMIKESIRSISEDTEGNIWLGHPSGVIKIKKFKHEKGIFEYRKN
ncbi:MAG: hypothetical protein V1781_08055, partial [Bacteroidota bacterium]